MPSRARFVTAAHGQAREEPPRAGPSPGVRLTLLNAFELSRGGASIDLPMSAQRVLAFLALHDGPILRLYVAGNLWLDVSEDRAYASLRSALWRLRRAGCDSVEATNTRLRLAPGVVVDVRQRVALARRVLDGAIEDEEAGLAGDLLAGELLPDWYEDWVLIERERLRQLRLHALEALCERLTAARRFTEAVEAGLVAVAGEPLRESAHCALIKAHLAEGNRGEAIRQYRMCRQLLREHLGFEPSSQTKSLVRRLLVRSAAR
jgi:DNA-binding SARP family transcriptional activator